MIPIKEEFNIWSSFVYNILPRYKICCIKGRWEDVKYSQIIMYTNTSSSY